MFFLLWIVERLENNCNQCQTSLTPPESIFSHIDFKVLRSDQNATQMLMFNMRLQK